MKTEEVDQQVPTSDGVSARVRAAWDVAASITRRTFAAALFTSVALAGSMPGTYAERVALAIAGCCLATSALVDTVEHRLPNRLLAVAAVVSLAAAVLQGMPSVAVGGLFGAAIAGGAMLLVRLTRGVGMGDVKMAAAIGLSLGQLDLIAAPAAIAIAAVVAATYGMTAGRVRLALGPSLWFGWAAAIAAVSVWS